MKTESRKIHRNFKLAPAMDARLRKEAAKTRRTQTAILEMALELFFSSGRKTVGRPVEVKAA